MAIFSSLDDAVSPSHADLVVEYERHNMCIKEQKVSTVPS